MLIQFEDQVKRYAVNFYDGFASKLLSDYTQGNRRTEAAIKHALGWIPPDAKRVLDIGCGIGWSTWEIGKRCSRAEIVGVDLSPKLSEIAIRLHRRERTRFMVQDVCHELPPDMGRFDAVVLLDVYEHIPTFRRAGFHNVLDRLLDESGIVIFTCPTPKHQAYLRDHKPDGLQPVDEDVTRNDIALIAEAICGRTVCYKDVSIWSEND